MQQKPVRFGAPIAPPRPTWSSVASDYVDGLEQETSTPEGRKAFYAGDGVTRARSALAQLGGLQSRLEKLIRA